MASPPTIGQDRLRDIASEVAALLATLPSPTATERRPVSPTAAALHLTTPFDLSVEHVLVEALTKILPVPICSEETLAMRSDALAEICWLVDPVDGTVHLARGGQYFTTMVALVCEWKPVVGAVRQYDSPRVIVAFSGGGTWSGTARHVVPNRDISQAIVSLEMPSSDPRFSLVARELFSRALPLHLCAAGYESLLMCTGQIDARLTVNASGRWWDYAPMVLICAEAGMVVEHIAGGSFSLENLDFIACSESILDWYREALQDLFIQERPPG